METNRVLVTGADGFICSHLTELLVREGYRVKALAQYNSFNSWGWLEQVACRDEIEVVCGDVRDAQFCREICRNVDLVFHLAALIAIPYSYSAPQSYVETNVAGTLNVCQAALDNSVQRVIHTSTSEVYGTAKYVPIDEQHPLQPQSPYSASKIGADAIAMSFANSFGLRLTIARPFNTYGPRQSARAVIPTIISQIASGRKEIRLGDLRPTRDFNYVADTCRGLLALARCERAVGETVNIGSGTEISIRDTLETIRELMGANVEFLADEQRLRPAGSEVFRLCCDTARMREWTGYAPAVSLRDGLRKTVEWFTQPANLARYKPGVYNV
jgi:NAD dependent epimerase/dehydratase